jgi:hypothetical protein
VLTEGVPARSAVLKCAANSSGVSYVRAPHVMLYDAHCTYVLQASSYTTDVTRRSAVLKCAANPSLHVVNLIVHFVLARRFYR